MDFGRIWAEVDLDALDRNLEQVSDLAGDRRVMVAVKADAYGHGLREVAAEIAGRVDSFGVASVEEGISLRASGIADTDILVLSPAPYTDIPDIVRHRLTPSVTEDEFARRLSAEAGRAGATVDVHVEVDTGMGRTGVTVEEAPGFAAATAGLPGIRLRGVFTHFPSADNDVAFTTEQVRRFSALVERLRTGHPDLLCHAANSAGLLNVADSRLDMIRPGLVVYGILPESYHSGHRHTTLDLQPVMSVRSRVVNLRDIPAGNSISYDRNFFTARDSRIAVITAGYGDGYPYGLTNRGEAIIRGSRVPVVGNVCMDLTMLDVTDVPAVRIGDPVTLLGTSDGDTITANDIASRAGTIAYEIICRVSPRVPRVYLRGGRVTRVKNLLNHTLEGSQID